MKDASHSFSILRDLSLPVERPPGIHTRSRSNEEGNMSAPPGEKIDLEKLLYRAQELVVRIETRLTQSREAIERSQKMIEALERVKDRTDC